MSRTEALDIARADLGELVWSIDETDSHPDIPGQRGLVRLRFEMPDGRGRSVAWRVFDGDIEAAKEECLLFAAHLRRKGTQT